MTLSDLVLQFGLLDAAALVALFASWLGLTFWIEHTKARRPSVTVIMIEYRRAWLREFVTREPRIFDAQILTNLRQSTAFFSSGCMIAIGGVLALVGNTEPLRIAANDLSVGELPDVVWQLKLLTIVLFLTHGFLKFVWSNRLFGYCAVIMASVPNDATSPIAYPRADQAAEINIRAAWNFNRGLRSIYFSLGTLAWLLGPIALMGAICVVCYIIWQREFSSTARKILDTTPPSK